jgi:hypothetical protein
MTVIVVIHLYHLQIQIENYLCFPQVALVEVHLHYLPEEMGVKEVLVLVGEEVPEV